MKRWWLLAAKALIVVLVVWGVHRAVWAGWLELRAQWAGGTWRLRPAWLAAAAAVYLLGLLPCGLFWHRVLADLGQRASLLKVLRAYFVGHLGKYVPGKAMVVVLRTSMARTEGCNTRLVAASVFYETLTSMAVAALVAAAIIAVAFHEQRLLLALGIGTLLVAGLPTLPPVFDRLVRWLRLGRFEPGAGQARTGQAGTGPALPAGAMARVGYRTLAGGWLSIGVGWWLVGLSLWATLKGVGATGDWLVNWPLCTAAAALATVAGFVSLLPGGLLVRESVLVQLLVLIPGIDPAQALAAAVVLRLVWLVAEAAISGILYPCFPS